MNSLHQFLELFGKPEWSLLEAHQASTHLSIGLLLGAALFDVGATLVPKQQIVWRGVAFWLQIAGWLALAATFALGFYGNPFAGKSSELAQKTEWHKNFAYFTLGAFALLGLWRIARHKKWSRVEGGLFALVNVVALIAITATGWMGGHIMK